MMFPKPKKIKKKPIKNENITEEIPCYVCPEGYEEQAVTYHEPIGGKNRQLSITYGLHIPVCNPDHVKLHQDKKFNNKYQKEMQRRFEKKYSHKEFMKVFGKNYL